MLKKISKVLALLVTAFYATSAAAYVKLTDINNPYEWMTEGETHTIWHDLSDDGVPNELQVKHASLYLGFSDSQWTRYGWIHWDWTLDWAVLTGEGLSGIWEVDGTHRWGYDIVYTSVGQNGIDSLNADGYLRVSITALALKDGSYNDFWWKTSKLVAYAEPVPEPNVLMLLGFGLAGIVVASRRRRSRS